MDGFNPYEAPKSPGRPRPPGVPRRPRGTWKLALAWTAVGSINLVVPLWTGQSLTAEHDAAGVFGAITLIWGLGCGLCVVQPSALLRLTLGGVLVALSQLFPILQLLSGLLGVSIARDLGLMSEGDPDQGLESFASERGGFVVTSIVAAILLTASLALGAALEFLLPKAWHRLAASLIRQPSTPPAPEVLPAQP